MAQHGNFSAAWARSEKVIRKEKTIKALGPAETKTAEDGLILISSQNGLIKLTSLDLFLGSSEPKRQSFAGLADTYGHLKITSKTNGVLANRPSVVPLPVIYQFNFYI